MADLAVSSGCCTALGIAAGGLTVFNEGIKRCMTVLRGRFSSCVARKPQHDDQCEQYFLMFFDHSASTDNPKDQVLRYAVLLSLERISFPIPYSGMYTRLDSQNLLLNTYR